MGRAVLKSVMLLLVAVTAGFAQSKTTQLRNIDQSTITRLQQNIPGLMQKGKIPGLSIALIRDGKTYWVKSFGVKNTPASTSSNGSQPRYGARRGSPAGGHTKFFGPTPVPSSALRN